MQQRLHIYPLHKLPCVCVSWHAPLALVCLCARLVSLLNLWQAAQRSSPCHATPCQPRQSVATAARTQSHTHTQISRSCVCVCLSVWLINYIIKMRTAQFCTFFPLGRGFVVRWLAYKKCKRIYQLHVSYLGPKALPKTVASQENKLVIWCCGGRRRLRLI